MNEAATAVQLLRAPDVLERTGATYRQLDYWARAGHLPPDDAESATGTARKAIEDITSPGQGRAKLWHPAEVEIARRAVLVARALPHLTNDVVFRIARATTPVDLGDGIVVTTPWSAT